LSDHLTEKQFDDYSRQQFSVQELVLVSAHIGECDACRRGIESAMNSDAAFFALRSEVFGEEAQGPSPSLLAHLTPDQMCGYVDRNVFGDEFQVVADHLNSCEQCALAVDDLSAFRNQIAPSLEREYHPAPVAPSAEGWWRRTVKSLSPLFRMSPGLAFGTALAVLLLAVTGWLILRTIPERGTQEIVVAPTPTPIVSPVSPSQPALPQPELATVVAQVNDGARLLTLDKEGKLSGADDLPPAYRSLLKKALTTGRVEQSSQLNGLNRRASSLMSSDNSNESFSVIEPVGNVLMTNQPTFRWSALKGAKGYVVEIYDSNFRLVSNSQQLTSQSWVSPQSLPRGEVYSWQVKAIKEGEEVTSPRPPSPQAKFRILDQGKANELAKARRAYASSHLTLGLLYAEAGLLKESEQELRILQKANPDSELARTLLRHIQALRRRNE
jgi:anti-sigma factor RsiW